MRRIALACAVVSLCTAASVAWGQTGGILSTGNHHPNTRHTKTHHGKSRRKTGQTSSTLRIITAATAAPATTAAASDPVLFGDQQVETSLDNNVAGSAEAFPFTGQITGTAQTISVYVDSHNKATTFIAGLYADNGGQPGARLATGSLSSPKAGAWNTIAITSTNVSAGQTYWLAVLGKGGFEYFRDRTGGPCQSVNSSQSSLTSLPTTWSSGPQWDTCPISAYVSGTATSISGGLPGSGSSGSPSPGSGTGITVPPVNTAAPQISGTPMQGQSLTTTDGTWTGSPTGYSYQWEGCDSLGVVCSNISGATSSSYTLTSNDIGKTIRVVVTGANAGGSTPGTSVQTAAVAPQPAPSNSAAPQISGTAVQGHTLTTTNGTWANSPTSYAYQWEDCDGSGNNCTAISGATASSYTLTIGDVGNTLRVAVTAANGGGSAAATSQPTATVASAPPSNTALPQISGTTMQGHALTATTGTWSGSPTGYTYAWQDCDTSGSNCSAISGATSSTYTLASGDVGHTIRVIVSAANAGGSTPATSSQTAAIASPPPPPPSNTSLPTISGTMAQGQTLTTTKGSWTNSPTAYTYAWQDCDTSGSNCSTISGASAGSYTLASGDVGHTVRALVTATNAGGSNSATSQQTSAVAGPPAAPSNTAPPQISGTATQGQTLTTNNGTWTGSPTSYSYQWQDCDTSGANCSSISGATSNNLTLTAADVGHTIDVVVKATNSGGSASQTSVATAVVASSGGATPRNCLGTAGSGVVSYSSLDSCGYPSPNTTGVPSGTSLTTVGSINCSNTTINAVTTSGSVTIGNNCTITNSRLTGGQITVPPGITGVQLIHDEISGPYTGTPANPTCTYSSGNGNSSDVLWEGAASGLTMNYDYLHCASEPFNGEGTIKNSYIISDECWGPCGSGSTTHNEAVYTPGGDSGGTVIDHNTVLNPWSQTAGIFGDDHAWGPIHNLTINNNLVADQSDNGAIATGNAGDGNSNVNITNNRLSYVYSTSMPTGGSSASTWTGNYRDDTLAPVPVSG